MFNPTHWQHASTPSEQANELRSIIQQYNTNEGNPRLEHFPGHTREALVRMVEHGFEPGGFVQAVLDNDLVRAAGKADHINRDNLAFIALVISWVGLREWLAYNNAKHETVDG